MGIFRDAKGQLTPVPGRIWSNFELVRDVMNFLVTCQYEEDPIKKRGARVFTTLYIAFFRRARADNSGVGGGILSKFSPFQAYKLTCQAVLVTCKNEDDRFKNEGARVFTRVLPL